MNKKIAILYSGGTDSTCAASIMAEKYTSVELITFYRTGFHDLSNANNNLVGLQKRHPEVAFDHHFLNVDKLANFLINRKFFKKILKFGFLPLSNCVYCGLIHHLGALIYCLNNNISFVADGSTREWPFFPTHMRSVLESFKNAYKKFNIQYETPVYGFDVFREYNFIDKILGDDYRLKQNKQDLDKNTTGNYLYKNGLMDNSNVKGTQIDHNIQPRCWQFVFHHIFLHGYFAFFNKYENYQQKALEFIDEQIDDFICDYKTNEEKYKKLVFVADIERSLRL